MPRRSRCVEPGLVYHVTQRSTALGAISLNWGPWHEAGAAEGWRELIGAGEKLQDVIDLRRCTYSGRPFGNQAFVERMEKKFDRRWREPGRPKKPVISEMGTEQSAFFFASWYSQ